MSRVESPRRRSWRFRGPRPPERAGPRGQDRGAPLRPARRGDPLPLLLVLLTLALHLPAVGWGLPHATSDVTVRGWEFDSVAGIGVLSELHNLLVEPKDDWYVAYPVLHYLILAAAYAPYLLVLLLTGGLDSPSGAYPYGMENPVGTVATLVLIGRLVTLAMACGTVVAVYQAVRAVGNRRAGLLAALAMLAAVPMAYYSRTSNLDVPVLFWTALGLWTTARILAHGYTVRRGVWLGIFAALAVATKDQAYGGWIGAFLVLWAGRLAVPAREGAAGRRWAGPAATVGAGLAAFALAGGLLFWPGRFAAHLEFVRNYQTTFFNVAHLDLLRSATPAGCLRLVGDVGRALLDAAGPVLPALAAAGAVLVLRRGRPSPLRRFAAVLLALAVAHVVLVILPVRHMQFRYVLPLLPVVAAFAAWAVDGALRRGRVVGGAAAAAAALGLLWPAVRTADLTYQMLNDVRYPAGKWLAEHVGAGERVAFFGAVSQLPAIPAGVRAVPMPLEVTAATLRRESPEYVLVIPDWSNDPERERSLFLPADLYRGLLDGSLGYRRVAAFDPPSLLGGPVPGLPHVNPPVQVFRRTGAGAPEAAPAALRTSGVTRSGSG